MNGKMGYQLHLMSLEKVEKVTLTQFLEHYSNVCQVIRCLMLSLLTMFKLKSMCWRLISLDLPIIPCLLLAYYNAYFVVTQNKLADHFLLHIIFCHKLCLFCRTLVSIKTFFISCLLDIHKHVIRLFQELISMDNVFACSNIWPGAKFFYVCGMCAKHGQKML